MKKCEIDPKNTRYRAAQKEGEGLTEKRYQEGRALIDNIIDYAYISITDNLQKGKGNINFATEYHRLLDESEAQNLLRETAAEAFSRNLWTIIPITIPPAPNRAIQALQILFIRPGQNENGRGEPSARPLTDAEIEKSTRTGEDGISRFTIDETGEAYSVPPGFAYIHHFVFDALQYIKFHKPLDEKYFYTKNGIAARALEYIDPEKVDEGAVIEERGIVYNPETGIEEIQTLHTLKEIPANTRDISIFLELHEGIEATAAVLPSVLTALDMVQEQIQQGHFETDTATITLRDYMKETGEKNYPAAREKLSKAIKFLYHISLENKKAEGEEHGKRLFDAYDIPKESKRQSEEYSLTLSKYYLAALKAIPYNIKRSRNLHRIPDRYRKAARIARDITAQQRYDANHPQKEGFVNAVTILDKYFPERKDNFKHGDKKLRIDPFFTELEKLLTTRVFARIVFHEGNRRYSFATAKERYKTAASLEGVQIEGINAPGHGDYSEVKKKQKAAKEKTRKKPRRKPATQEQQ